MYVLGRLVQLSGLFRNRGRLRPNLDASPAWLSLSREGSRIVVKADLGCEFKLSPHKLEIVKCATATTPKPKTAESTATAPVEAGASEP